MLGLLLAHLLGIMKWLEDWETWFSKGAMNKIAWWIGHIGTYRLILAKLWLMISSLFLQFELWTIKAVGWDEWIQLIYKWCLVSPVSFSGHFLGEMLQGGEASFSRFLGFLGWPWSSPEFSDRPLGPTVQPFGDCGKIWWEVSSEESKLSMEHPPWKHVNFPRCSQTEWRYIYI